MAGKAELIEHLVGNVEGMTARQAKIFVDEAFRLITQHLQRGERVRIPGFGSFSISRRAARKGRNPATGAAIVIQASRNVRFAAAKELKSGLASYARPAGSPTPVAPLTYICPECGRSKRLRQVPSAPPVCPVHHRPMRREE